MTFPSNYKFQLGEIVSNRDGWKRRIVARLNEDGKNHYIYRSENLDENLKPIEGFDRVARRCSESHLISWLKK